MWILDWLSAMLASDQTIDVLHRAGAIQRNHGCDIFDGCRLQLLDVARHAAALELERAEGVAFGHQIERRLVVQWHFVDVDLFAAVFLDDLETSIQYREVRQPQEVPLEQPGEFDLVHRELSRCKPVIVAFLRTLQSRVVDQRFVRDNDPGRMGADVPDSPLDSHRLLEHLGGRRVLEYKLLQLDALFAQRSEAELAGRRLVFIVVVRYRRMVSNDSN